MKKLSELKGPPKVLDLFCGAGAASKGYAAAGFDVIGVDIRKQENYPYEFHQFDAMELVSSESLLKWLKGQGVTLVHCSPPCQSYSISTMALAYPRPRLIEPLQAIFESEWFMDLGLSWVIENVPGAPMYPERTIMLCGTMFRKRFWRHRLFESGGSGWGSEKLIVPPWTCDHSLENITTRKSGGGKEWMEEIFGEYSRDEWGAFRPWLTQREASQAVPPAYTEYIGLKLLNRS